MGVKTAGTLHALDGAECEAVLGAIRALLWISTAADAAVVTETLVRDLGGQIVDARDAASMVGLPVDLSLGTGPPTVPMAPPGSHTEAVLQQYLPEFVRDAHRAVELAERASRLAEDASIDPLTGLANRRALGRILGRLRAGQAVVMIDLDHFKAVNDTLGHQEGDAVLRALGRTLSATLRASDRAGRYGGEEFVVVLGAAAGAGPFLERLRRAWTTTRPHPITFSAGIAVVGANTQHAVAAADRAMYRAKQGGRDRWCIATEEEQENFG